MPILMCLTNEVSINTDLSTNCPGSNKCSSSALDHFVGHTIPTIPSVPHMCFTESVTQVNQQVVDVSLIALGHFRNKLREKLAHSTMPNCQANLCYIFCLVADALWESESCTPVGGVCSWNYDLCENNNCALARGFQIHKLTSSTTTS